MSETTLKILRQEGPDRPETRRWDVRAVAVDAVTVADALAAHPDVAWDDRCTWPSCGTCTRSARRCSRRVAEPWRLPRGRLAWLRESVPP